LFDFTRIFCENFCEPILIASEKMSKPVNPKSYTLSYTLKKEAVDGR